MTKVLFVCLGNICRSPMAEFVLKDMVRRRGLEEEFIIESRGTSSEEIGNDVHYGTVRKLNSVGVPVEHRQATKFTKRDYDEFDYIIGMEARNVRDIMTFIDEDPDDKVCRLLDYSNNPRDIADPWYTGNFDITYQDVVEGCEAFLKSIT
ncbi:MAG: low molecular weight phosphotyrosine protein phosphatase [Clostridia bacterium]|nr:low molecular weight phosphotyrosine protein phosphatase [Clostridia bacterium]